MDTLITLDHQEGWTINLSSFPVKNLHALHYIPRGLQILASTVRDHELMMQRDYKGLVHAQNPPGIAIVTNVFGWFSVSLASYLRLIRLLVLMQERNWSTGDLRSNRNLIKSTCTDYIKTVVPAVYQWRNKVAAHPAFTDPFEEDSIGTLELSVMVPVTFIAPHYFAGVMQWSSEGESSNFSEWSATKTFEQLGPRLWPELLIEPLG